MCGEVQLCDADLDLSAIPIRGGVVAKSKLVGLLFEAWNDLDRVITNLTPEEMVSNVPGGSSFAWTVAHTTDTMDAWINVRFQGLPPHPVLSQRHFRFGGSGIAEDWPAIEQGIREVRGAARIYLQDKEEKDLELTIPYDGSRLFLHERGLNLRHALLRNCAHHYFHIGEIATKRDRLGHKVGDYPGPLLEAI
jgi:DinB superfamily